MNGCPEETALDDFVSGRLTGTALEQLDAHLLHCPDCSALIGILAANATPAQKSPESVAHYELHELLGEGVSGRVFRAWDPRLERDVALKVLRPELATDPQVRERFLREAKVMARLSHPNLVAIFDAGEDAHGALYLAMEFVRGPTLRTWLATNHPTTEQLVTLVQQLAEGLAAAHAQGILHRDVKPENIILAEGRPRLTDFGLARVDTVAEPFSDEQQPDNVALTRTGALIGTPLYMAPELLEGQPATERSDLFALAITCYEAIEKVRPFEAPTLRALKEAQQQGAKRCTHAPTTIDTWIRSALERNPQDRPVSVRAWLDALRQQQQRRSRLQRSAFAFASVALLSVGALALRRTPPAPAPCNGNAVLQSEFGPTQFSAIEAGFLRTQAPFARASYQRVAAELERWKTRWSTRYEQACNEDRARSATAPDRTARAQCLARARTETSAIVAALAQPSREAVERIPVQLSELLPSVEACEDVRALTEQQPRPTEPALRTHAQNAEAAVGRARASFTAGNFSSAEQHASTAVNESVLSTWGVVESEARRWLAMALRRSGQAPAAEEQARRAALRAEASRDDRGAALAWLERVAAAGERGAWNDVTLALEQAEASVTRVGDARMRASLSHLRGLALSNLGQLDAAREQLQQSLAARERLALDRSPTLTALANIAREQGDFPRALALHTQAMQLDAERDGEQHPERARHLHNLGGVLRRMGRRDEARARYLEALRIEDQNYPPEATERGLTRNSLGLLALENGSLDEAAQWLGEAEQRLANRPEQALVRLNQALLALQRQQNTEAIRLAREALALDRTRFDETHVRIARAHKVLGLALAANGQREEARSELLTAQSAMRTRTDSDSRAIFEEATQALAQLQTPPRRPAVVVRRRVDPPTPPPPPVMHAAPSGSGSYGGVERWDP